MDDALLKTVDDIRKVADQGGLKVFLGYLSEESKVPSVYWNRENGGDWRDFLVCARAVGAGILYLNWAPFEQFEIDDAVSALESRLAEGGEGADEERELLNKVRTFQSKVGLTCAIDLAFLANGVIHICQETTEWFDAFSDLTAEEEEDNEPRHKQPVSKEVVDKWARALASDPKYATSKDHEYLLEKVGGDELPKLPMYEILRRAETIYEADFKEAAEKELATEAKRLRDKGMNQSAIAIKLGISKDRVSGLLSAFE